MGRQTKYTPELAQRVCEKLRTGKTLTSICRNDPELPYAATVLRWVDENPDNFAEQYTRARIAGYTVMGDEILDIADDVTGDQQYPYAPGGEDEVDEDGEPLTPRQRNKLNHENVQRSRLKVDTRKWLLSKALPKVFGDRLALDHSGSLNLGERLLASRKRTGK